jgi:hypothetical protein
LSEAAAALGASSSGGATGGLGGIFGSLFGGGGDSAITGGGDGAISSATDMMSTWFHSGGVVGAGGRPGLIGSSIFAGAKRFHSGGLPGLMADEIPAILQRGEEVLTRNDPRNVLNGGAGGGGARGMTIVNTLDPGEVLSAALGSPLGHRVFVNHIRANKSTVNAALA